MEFVPAENVMRAWISRCMPVELKNDLTELEIASASMGLAYQGTFEEHFTLNFKTHALVLCPDTLRADEEVLKRYDGEHRAIASFNSYVSSEPVPHSDKHLRLIKLVFSSPLRKDEIVSMPLNMGPVLYREALQNDAVQFRFFQTADCRKSVLVFGWRNVQRRFFLYNLARLCRRYGLRMSRLTFSFLSALSVDSVLLGTIHLEGSSLSDSKAMGCFTREFELSKNFRGDDGLSRVVEDGVISGEHAIILSALGSLLEQVLADVDSETYTEEMIFEAFAHHEELTVALLRIFEARFKPTEVDAESFERLSEQFRTDVDSLDTGFPTHDKRRSTIFSQALNVVSHILRTNAYCNGKLSIGFRLDPKYLDCIPGFDRSKKYPDKPRVLLFIRGWNYISIHVALRDLARGGLRTEIPWDPEQERYQRASVFEECYNLAVTQQKKNKDIPEGGAQTLIFLKANEELPHEMEFARRELTTCEMGSDELTAALERYRAGQEREYLYYNQRSFIRTLLSMSVWNYGDQRLASDNIVDYLKQPEHIFLGSDENLHDTMIEWAASTAREMHYHDGGAFISGKPTNGWSHRRYSFAAHGLMHFVDQALCKSGLGNKPFTVKMTGGPAGELAGSCIRELANFFTTEKGCRVSIVAITDRSGTAYDPAGINLEELLRMTVSGDPIAHYPTHLLHVGAWLLCMGRERYVTDVAAEIAVVTSDCERWISSSAAHHMQEETVYSARATVFIPCGGRQRTLHIDNVSSFLGSDGMPTSGIVVEGANNYLTPEARHFLEKRGVLLFKDSSANKCGVISSSFEELVGLSLTDGQFERLREQLTRDVQRRLAAAASSEARCMLDYYDRLKQSVPLSIISDRISAAIAHNSDLVIASLADVDLNDPNSRELARVFENVWLPESMRCEEFAVQARMLVPDAYKKAAIATLVACKVVYTHGPDWRPSAADILPLILDIPAALEGV